MAFAWAWATGARRTSAQAIGAASNASAKILAKASGVGGRQGRSDEIERAARGISGGQRHERQIGSETGMSPTNAAKSGVKARLWQT